MRLGVHMNHVPVGIKMTRVSRSGKFVGVGFPGIRFFEGNASSRSAQSESQCPTGMDEFLDCSVGTTPELPLPHSRDSDHVGHGRNRLVCNEGARVIDSRVRYPNGFKGATT